MDIKFCAHDALLEQSSLQNSLHNLQHDEGGNYMAETETETIVIRSSTPEGGEP